jgi:hypothetical protein
MTKMSRTLQLIALVLVSTPALADWEPPGKWSLAERQQWSALREEALIYLKIANDSCQTRIELDFDYESFRGRFKPNETKYGLDAYGRAHIAAPIFALDNICKVGDREKKAVGASLRRIKVTHGRKGGTAKSTISVAGKTLLPVIEPAGSAAGTWQDELERWIKSQL